MQFRATNTRAKRATLLHARSRDRRADRHARTFLPAIPRMPLSSYVPPDARCRATGKTKIFSSSSSAPPLARTVDSASRYRCNRNANIYLRRDDESAAVPLILFEAAIMRRDARLILLSHRSSARTVDRGAADWRRGHGAETGGGNSRESARRRCDV